MEDGGENATLGENIIFSKGEIKFSIDPPSRNASGYWSVASICGGGMWRL
jgi:hypothetical protein